MNEFNRPFVHQIRKEIARKGSHTFEQHVERCIRIAINDKCTVYTHVLGIKLIITRSDNLRSVCEQYQLKRRHRK